MHLLEQAAAPSVVFEKVTEAANHRLVGRRLPAEVDADEAAHGSRVIERLRRRRIGEVEPLLRESRCAASAPGRSADGPGRPSDKSARSARPEPATARRAPSRPGMSPAASSCRNAQSPPSPSSPAVSFPPDPCPPIHPDAHPTRTSGRCLLQRVPSDSMLFRPRPPLSGSRRHGRLRRHPLVGEHERVLAGDCGGPPGRSSTAKSPSLTSNGEDYRQIGLRIGLGGTIVVVPGPKRPSLTAILAELGPTVRAAPDL